MSEETKGAMFFSPIKELQIMLDFPEETFTPRSGVVMTKNEFMVKFMNGVYLCEDTPEYTKEVLAKKIRAHKEKFKSKEFYELGDEARNIKLGGGIETIKGVTTTVNTESTPPNKTCPEAEFNTVVGPQPVVNKDDLTCPFCKRVSKGRGGHLKHVASCAKKYSEKSKK